MSQQYVYSINPDASMEAISQTFTNRLSAYGYKVSPVSFGDAVTNYNVIKIGSDLEQFAGMLPECRILLTKSNNQLYMNIEDIWTNKILAGAIGWLLCGIGIVTCLIGVSRQAPARDEIQQAMFTTLSELG